MIKKAKTCRETSSLTVSILSKKSHTLSRLFNIYASQIADKTVNANTVTETVRSK